MSGPPLSSSEGSVAPLPAPSSSRGAVLRGRLSLQVLGVYLALLLIWTGLAFASPYFLTVDNIRNIFVAASTLELVAAGLTIVMIAGEIDLSVAAMQAFGGSIAAVLIINHGVWWPLGIVLALSLCTLAGAVSGAVAVIGRLATFITTLAMLGIVQGTAFLLTGGQPVNEFPGGYSVVGNDLLGPIPIAVIVVVVVYLVLHLVLTQTEFGLRIFAVGGNRTAATRVGISEGRIIIAVLALSGFLAGLAGIILSSRLNAASGDYGGSDLLPVFAGVIIGGTSLTGGVGSLFGSFAGILIVVTINDGLTLLNVSQFWQQIVVGLMIMVAVLVDQAAKGYIDSGHALNTITRLLRPAARTER
jgi:ribose transport system permease protein